jgi:membrane-associated protease RseP (regulator of RpoE activity)
MLALSGKPGLAITSSLFPSSPDRMELCEMPVVSPLLLSLVVCAALAMIVHELGHLVAARCCKVGASELGLGMGPKLLGFQLGSLSFSLRAFPIGSFLRIDGTALKERSAAEQLFVHLGGIIFNVVVGLATFGTMFSWLNLLLAAGNLLPLYQHDGWRCGVVIMRALLQRKSRPVERAFTFSGGFVSLALLYAIIKVFI